jgi:protein-disulfide isomerase
LKDFKKEILFAYRHFPLHTIHPHAEHAAETSEIAGAKGKFWEMHHLLFDNQAALDDESLLGYAVALDIDPDNFRSDLVDGTYQPRVWSDFESGVRSGVSGTPTFFINGEWYDGEFTYPALAHALERAGWTEARV